MRDALNRNQLEMQAGRQRARPLSAISERACQVMHSRCMQPGHAQPVHAASACSECMHSRCYGYADTDHPNAGRQCTIRVTSGVCHIGSLIGSS